MDCRVFRTDLMCHSVFFVIARLRFARQTPNDLVSVGWVCVFVKECLPTNESGSLQLGQSSAKELIVAMASIAFTSVLTLLEVLQLRSPVREFMEGLPDTKRE